MKQLIIRADDIGYSEAVNYGIEKSVKEGLIGSAGLMPNMPFAEHGLKLLEGTGIAIGQHTNMCLEKPCSDPKDIPSLVDENGYLKSSRTYREAFKNGEDFVVVEEAVLEIEAQYRRFKELVGKNHLILKHMPLCQTICSRHWKLWQKNMIFLIRKPDLTASRQPSTISRLSCFRWDPCHPNMIRLNA